MEDKQKSASQQETSEAIKLAWQMYEQETSETQNKQALLDAYTELGLPPVFVERATAQLRARHAAKQHRRSLMLAAGLGAVVVLCGFGAMSALQRPAPVPAIASPTVTAVLPQPVPEMPASAPEPTPEPASSPPSRGPNLDFRTMPASAWQVRSNPGSQALLRFVREPQGNRWARLEVRHFHSDEGGPYRGQYWNSLRHESDPMDLRGSQYVTIRARGRGLQNIRFAFWGSGPHLWTEIWNSPLATLTPDWKEFTFALHDFSYAARKSVGVPFMSPEWKRPQQIGALEVETGVYVNPVTARGVVEIARISFH